jgi:homoserine O-acetyltransferase/O-succinyltransferase
MISRLISNKRLKQCLVSNLLANYTVAGSNKKDRLSTQTFHFGQPFTLDSGKTLQGYHLAYTTLGAINAAGDNVVWIFHALTANSNPLEWWPGLVGEGKLFDPATYFIVCVNMPGSCYGSTGPLDVDAATALPYYHQFGFFTTRDMIRAYQPLCAFLGIDKIHTGIGGSMGGQQLLEWAVEEPGRFQHIIPIATNAVHSPWAIAFNASQRYCIEIDPTWHTNEATAGIAGMQVARSVALLSYRNYETYASGQSEDGTEKISDFKSESYQRYQGRKLAERFNAFSYYALSKSMDSHNVGRGRGGTAAALSSIRARALVIGIETDILFPLSEQRYLADHIPDATFAPITSSFGHDGFLLEYDAISRLIERFYEQHISLNHSWKHINS